MTPHRRRALVHPLARPVLAAAVTTFLGGLVAAAAERQPGEPTGSVTVTASPSALARRVAEALRGSDLMPGAHLAISDSNGIVTVSGWTATLAARDRAARAVEAVPGVAFSRPVMVVRPTGKSSDDEIRARVGQALAAAGAADVHVAVARGVARLEGKVHDAEARQAAEAATAAVDGVVEMEDVVALEPVAASRSAEVPVSRTIEQHAIAAADATISAGGRLVVVDGVTYEARALAERRTVEPVSPGYQRVTQETRLLLTPRPD